MSDRLQRGGFIQFERIPSISEVGCEYIIPHHLAKKLKLAVDKFNEGGVDYDEVPDEVTDGQEGA